MSIDDNLWHKRLSDFEPYDHVEFKVVPRWKTSGLSGDEWRQHVEVSCYFKGEMVLSYGCSTMDWAIKLWHSKICDQPLTDTHIKLEHLLCDQPSCIRTAAIRCILKEEFSSSGDKLAPPSYSPAPVKYRQFCADHARRGDCGREDSDRNYEVESLVEQKN